MYTNLKGDFILNLFNNMILFILLFLLLLLYLFKNNSAILLYLILELKLCTSLLFGWVLQLFSNRILSHIYFEKYKHY